jgi:hypothetical protein
MVTARTQVSRIFPGGQPQASTSRSYGGPRSAATAKEACRRVARKLRSQRVKVGGGENHPPDDDVFKAVILAEIEFLTRKEAKAAPFAPQAGVASGSGEAAPAAAAPAKAPAAAPAKAKVAPAKAKVAPAKAALAKAAKITKT